MSYMQILGLVAVLSLLAYMLGARRWFEVGLRRGHDDGFTQGVAQAAKARFVKISSPDEIMDIQAAIITINTLEAELKQYREEKQP